MKLLEKRQVTAQFQLERTKQVQEGVRIAERVDALREAKASEEKQLLEYRTQMRAKIQEEINEKLAEFETVKSQVKEAIALRESLLKPLTEEWQAVNLEKSELSKEQDRTRIAKEQLKEEEARHALELLKLAAASEVNRAEEEKLVKEKKRLARLKTLTEQQYATALEEHNRSVEQDGKETARIVLLKDSYETGLLTLEAERKQVTEREEEVIKEKQLLADRSAMLERDIARLNKE